MIVVVGSRHDPVSASLVAGWSGAALCSAEDLTHPGWVWPAGADPEGERRWVVGGRVIADQAVTGVLVRRAGVYPEELVSTHPDDRVYQAEETYAFLLFVLATTRARVANPVVDGALGDAALPLRRWLPVAARCGLDPVPLRLADAPSRPMRWTPCPVDAVGDRTFGDAIPARRREAIARMMRALGLHWARFIFDSRGGLRTLTGALPPGTEAAAALGSLLAAGGAP